MNSIAVFTLSGLVGRLLGVIKVTGAGGQAVSLKSYIYGNVFAPLASPVNASLLFAISYVLFWLAMMWLLYRKRIFIKI